MKHPVVVTGSVLLCLMIIISVALIGLIALNGSRLEESSRSYDE
jgi:preprotein translocase subunit SecG